MRGAVIDLDRVHAIEEDEQMRFVAERPRSAALQERARGSMPGGVPTTWVGSLNFPHPPVWVTDAQGARFRDVDDHEYIDFLLGICLAFCGHAPAAVVEAVAGRAAQGSMFQQPTEDAVWVAEELSRRFPAASVAVRPLVEPVDPGLHPPRSRHDGAGAPGEVRRQLPRTP